MVAADSEAYSDNLAVSSIHRKSKTIYLNDGNYFAGVDLEGKKAGKILGRSSEVASAPDGHQVLSEKPRRPEKHELDLSVQWISQTCRRQAVRLGTGSLRPQREVFTNPAGSGTCSGISRTSLQCFQGAAEWLNSQVQARSLAALGCRAPSLLLAAHRCSPPGSGRKNGSSMHIGSR